MNLFNKANTSENQSTFRDLNCSFQNGFLNTKIYDKRHYFDFNTVNVPFFDGNVSRANPDGIKFRSNFIIII